LLSQEEMDRFLAKTPEMVLYYPDIVVVFNAKPRVMAVRPPDEHDRRIIKWMMGEGAL